MHIFLLRPWAAIAASVAILAAAGGVLYLHGNSLVADFEARQNAIMADSAKGAAGTIGREMSRLQLATALFAKQQSPLLADLAKHPNDAGLRNELARRINATFSNVISFSLVDEFGALLLPNPQQIIGPKCQGDISRYVIAHSGDPDAVYTPNTHFTRAGNEFKQHFDIIVKVPQSGFFFLSLDAATMQQLLKLHELPGHQLVLLSGDQTIDPPWRASTSKSCCSRPAAWMPANLSLRAQ